MSRTAPLWLAAPSRFAGLRSRRARIVIVAALLLVAFCLTALMVPDPPALTAMAGDERYQTDLGLYEKIVAGVKGGDNYYTAATDAMRAGGYPLRPFFTVRMPGLAVLLAALPGWASRLLLLALAVLTGGLWFARLRAALPRLVPRIAAFILLLGSLLAFLQPGLVAFHEIWAGLLVALSLALWRPGRWVEPAAIALVAMLIRETAVVYVVVMALFAWRAGARREALGWLAALALFAAVLAVHAWAVLGATGPLDPASPGWAGLQGFGLFVKAMTLATALQLLPLWAGALLVGLALVGWLAWDDPLGLRVAALLFGYALLLSVFARLDTFYWVLMAAPVFLAGLVFLPDGARDLVVRALDRRRVIVTRVAR